MNNPTGLEIAIIGINGKFPGANNLEEYWQNLRNGVESITNLTDEQIQKKRRRPHTIKTSQLRQKTSHNRQHRIL